MRITYTVVYINTDRLDLSEVINTYQSLDAAVLGLMNAAHYDTDDEGNLRQYRRRTDEYASFDELYQDIMFRRVLNDFDLYVINENVLD
jgi:hypothetical protein